MNAKKKYIINWFYDIENLENWINIQSDKFKLKKVYAIYNNNRTLHYAILKRKKIVSQKLDKF